MVAWSGRWEQLPTGLGLLATFFGGAVASAAVLSVLAPYALPETTNPFAMNSGGASAKGLLAFVGILAAMVISAPMLVASAFLEPWLVLPIGLGYGGLAAWLGTLAAGAILDRRGPEVLMAVTPRR
jgi:ABC-2 type transport system permease protein